MGFAPHMIVDEGAYFLVEGDIMIDKAALAAVPRDTSRIRKQWSTTSLVTQPVAVTVDLTGLSLNPTWQTAARGGMQNWSSLPGTSVTFTEKSPGGQVVLSYGPAVAKSSPAPNFPPAPARRETPPSSIGTLTASLPDRSCTC
jgi:hypothetical protein